MFPKFFFSSHINSNTWLLHFPWYGVYFLFLYFYTFLQIETAKANQEAVKKALADLQIAKTEEDIDRCRETVQEMREKSEKSIMVLQVGTLSHHINISDF